MSDKNYKEVHFDQWCNKCKYKDIKEFKDPCNECLETPARVGSHKPIKFKEKDN